jgi:hypothetical protein
MAAAMTSWEYMVIHLNVEPPAPPPATGPPDAGKEEGKVGNKPVFSRTFLAKEFPQFYEGQPQQPAAQQPQHPAQQLQTFLNGHGRQGWELVGVFPVGVLSMLFFRRPIGTTQAEPAAGAHPEPAAAVPAEPAAVSASPPPTLEQQATLERVLQRLTALEQRLPPPSPPPALRRSAAAPPAAAGQPIPQAGQRLQERLKNAPTLVTPAAAQAIGLRSAASLANLAARHGYLPGLYKVGPNGLAAVYTGLASGSAGGRPRRLWCVVPVDQLQDETENPAPPA